MKAPSTALECVEAAVKIKVPVLLVISAFEVNVPEHELSEAIAVSLAKCSKPMEVFLLLQILPSGEMLNRTTRRFFGETRDHLLREADWAESWRGHGQEIESIAKAVTSAAELLQRLTEIRYTSHSDDLFEEIRQRVNRL